MTNDRPVKPAAGTGAPAAAPAPAVSAASPAAPAVTQTQAPGEIGGPKGLEPTRYGDWERKGIVSDF